jgi:hypothetical protein
MVSGKHIGVLEGSVFPEDLRDVGKPTSYTE